jgi:hypothetical protein
MRQEAIRFSCTGCPATLKVKSSSAGKRLKCPKCKTNVLVPYPGQECLRKKCGECGTEHDFEHDDVCETCHAPASEQLTWCTVHRNLISSGVCADCLEQYHAVAFPAPKKKTEPPTVDRDRTAPPPITPPLPPIITTTTEPPAMSVNPGVDSRWPLWCGIGAVGSLFCCPCMAFLMGLLAIGMAADAQRKIEKSDQVGMVQFKIVTGYACGCGVVLLDGLRILFFVIPYLFS